jgi:hypothetical protein
MVMRNTLQIVMLKVRDRLICYPDTVGSSPTTTNFFAT